MGGTTPSKARRKRDLEERSTPSSPPSPAWRSEGAVLALGQVGGSRPDIPVRRNSARLSPPPLAMTLLLGWLLACGQARGAAASGAPPANAPPAPALPGFEIRHYEIRGDTLPVSDALASSLARHTGSRVSVAEIVNAAAALQREYGLQGRSNVCVSVAEAAITNCIATLHVFRGGAPLILVSGKRYASPALTADSGASPLVAAATNTPAPVRRLDIRAYEVTGDTLLTMDALRAVLVKNTGTNLTLTNILTARSDLQAEYLKRGFTTVRVTLPPQQVTNGIVKVQVFEGRLAEIEVTHNRYFSSNNVRRALPSLQTNTILVSPVFQAELDRANANQDRQIWPEIEPGPTEGTSLLNLVVKDRLPLHGKIDFNNQNSPGTPDLRVNSSLAYQNLWQLEHSVGVQYGFSPETYKTGDSWNFYDRPLVANYGAFYRLPLGPFNSLGEEVAKNRANFGYDEASRKFNLPAPSGRPELNFFASRSSIDTSLMTLFNGNIYNTNGNSLDRRDVQRDLTTTTDLGARLTLPLPRSPSFESGISGGLDYKTFSLTSAKTNFFTLTSIVVDTLSGSTTPVTNINRSTDVSPVPTTSRSLDYLPLSLHYDASLRDSRGVTGLGLGLGVNAWYSGSAANLRNVTGSQQSSGHWVILNPSLYREFNEATNWSVSARADGQWTSEPLMSNEQFGLGGLNGVRGYHEGEVFGDTGWRLTLEQKTPPCVVGPVYGNSPLRIRGALFMDYGEVYLMDPQGRQDRTELWGAGFGAVATVGPRWEARMFFSWPLLSAGTTSAMTPRFDFSLSAQF